MVKPKSANYLSYRVPIKSQQNPFPSTTPNPGYPVAFPILSLTRHCRLRINHICFAQAGCHCKPHIGNQCGSLHQLHYPASWQAAAGIYPLSRAHNPLCSEHSNNNSHPPSLACQLGFSNLERLQR